MVPLTWVIFGAALGCSAIAAPPRRGASAKAPKAGDDLLKLRKVHEGGLFVFEVADQAWWRAAQAQDNPYGAKLWPGALAAASRVVASCAGRRVLELGCGNGYASLAAARAGADVTATDVSALALALTRRAADAQGIAVHTVLFDVCGAEPLPVADILLVGDMLYDEPLAVHVARRVVEAANRGTEVVLGGDPDRLGRGAFVDALRKALPRARFEPVFTVANADANWKAKRVEILHLRPDATETNERIAEVPRAGPEKV